MKTISILAIFVCLVGCFGKPPIVKTGLEGQPIPAIDLLLEDSITHTNISTIEGSNPTVLFSFATWCPYCKAQTEAIVEEIDKLKDINFILITTSPYVEFKQFYNHYGLKQFNNITAGIDHSEHFYGYFQTQKVPYFAIYGRDKKLKQVLLGKSSIRLIKEIALR